MAFLGISLLSGSASALQAKPPLAPGKAAKPTAPPYGSWSLSKKRSAFDDSMTIALYTPALTTVSGWPNKVVRPTLFVRCQEGELEVFFNTDITAHPDGDTATFRLRWDNEAATSAELSEGTSRDAYFFGNSSAGALIGLLKHKRLVIGFTPFNSAHRS